MWSRIAMFWEPMRDSVITIGSISKNQAENERPSFTSTSTGRNSRSPI